MATAAEEIRSSDLIEPARAPMRLIVCVKQVPDVAELTFDHEKRTVVREGVRNVLNPFDRRALAEAIRIARLNGGEVSAITMGPPQAREALAECLAAGADKAIHLLDDAFAGSDTLATARALAAAISIRPFDLILCGRYSVDAETGQVGPEVAELLDIPHITGVCRLSFECEAGRLIAERETDDGFETIECTMPALLTAAERLVRPIKVKEPELDAARTTPIEIVTAAELSSDVTVFGEAGSPTRVCEIVHLESNRRVEMISGTIEEMARTLVDRLSKRGILGVGIARAKLCETATADAPVLAEGQPICIVAEAAGGALRRVSLELLGKGRELARRIGAQVTAVLIAGDASTHAKELAANGADRVCLIEGEQFADYNPFDYTSALVEAIRILNPHSVLIPSTANGRDLAPRVAARLGLGLTADCIGLYINELSELVQMKPAFGGQIVAPILSRTWPQMATVRPGMLGLPEADWSRSCPVEQLESHFTPDLRYRVLASSIDGGGAAADLDGAEVVICVGMGIGGPENLPLIAALGRALGKAIGGAAAAATGAEIKVAIGGSRRVVDAGWLSRQQQIGLTGKAVAPKLYLGVGVRGAFNHTIGIHRSGVIAAINSDPAADIFRAADYGIVADFAEFVPALISELDKWSRLQDRPTQ
jgi:electron transfer flavoprotein alpha subunit